jgi:hypothetical protein
MQIFALRHFAVAAVCKKWRTSEDVLDSSDRAQKISRGTACLLLAFKGRQLQKSNRQDMVMVLPPGIDKGGFQLRIDNVWFCKVLFLFSFVSQNDKKKAATRLCLCLCS